MASLAVKQHKARFALISKAVGDYLSRNGFGVSQPSETSLQNWGQSSFVRSNQYAVNFVDLTLTGLTGGKRPQIYVSLSTQLEQIAAFLPKDMQMQSIARVWNWLARLSRISCVDFGLIDPGNPQQTANEIIGALDGVGFRFFDKYSTIEKFVTELSKPGIFEDFSGGPHFCKLQLAVAHHVLGNREMVVPLIREFIENQNPRFPQCAAFGRQLLEVIQGPEQRPITLEK